MGHDVNILIKFSAVIYNFCVGNLKIMKSLFYKIISIILFANKVIPREHILSLYNLFKIFCLKLGYPSFVIWYLMLVCISSFSVTYIFDQKNFFPGRSWNTVKSNSNFFCLGQSFCQIFFLNVLQGKYNADCYSTLFQGSD